MDRLGRHVRQELGRFKPADGDIEAITHVWAVAVGETVARNAWPARLARDGTLYVNVASSTWAFELGKLAATILEQLGSHLAEKAPRALKFAPGPLPSEPPESPGPDPSQAPAIGSEHRSQGAAIAAGIEDEELRELVARAAAASLAGAPPQGPARPRDDHPF
ncbi:MAG TPA: DUF721 domain-containing protein [Gaiellaceae bacterium]|nr:DUF721 domain-containing protein [Gaiellaceae bacterium]